MNSQNSEVGTSGQRKLRLGCFSQLLIALVLLVVLAGLAILTWTLAASRRLDAVLADMRAAGYSTTVAELETSYGPPPESNSGPLWIEAGKALLADNAADTKTLPFIGSDWTGEIPQAGEAFPELEACKTYLARHGKELAMIRRAASDPNPPRYRDKIIDPPNTIVDRAFVNEHRLIQRVLRITALVQAHDQDFDRLCGTLMEQLRVGQSLRNEPTVMGQFISIACTQMALEDIQKYVRECELSDEQLGRLQTAMRESDPLMQMRRGMEGEFVFGLWGIDAATKPIPRNDDKRFLAEQVYKLLEATKSKDWGQIHATTMLVEQQCADMTANPTQMARYALSANSLLAYTRLTDAIARVQSHLAVTDAFIAAKRYELKHGELPTELQQLSPEFLPEVPVDPYSKNGELIVLPKDSGTALIYSRGFNRHDDGGSTKRDENRRPLDIVVELAK